MSSRLAVLLCSLIVALPGNAQVGTPVMERVLVPIFLTGTVNGAYGSEWKSELAITNRGDQPLAINGFSVYCPIPECELDRFFTLHEGATIYPIPADFRRSPPGGMLLIEQARLRDVAFSLRVQDVSRQALTWGTELPVIPESEALSGRAHFLNVPIDERFRVLLRVYDFTSSPGHRVRITGYSVDPSVTGELPGDRDPRELVPLFSMEADLLPGETVFVPGYAQIDLTNPVPVPAGTRLLVRIEPVTPFPYWAFINVTNNETQHVTVISPY